MTTAGPLLAEDQDRPYEYRRFKVGDRVRVRLSPECRQTRVSENGTHYLGHLPEENGRTGTVCEWPIEFGAVRNGHSICIDFDESFKWGRYTLNGSVYASSELEPLDPEATR